MGFEYLGQANRTMANYSQKNALFRFVIFFPLNFLVTAINSGAIFLIVDNFLLRIPYDTQTIVVWIVSPIIPTLLTFIYIYSKGQIKLDRKYVHSLKGFGAHLIFLFLCFTFSLINPAFKDYDLFIAEMGGETKIEYYYERTYDRTKCADPKGANPAFCRQYAVKSKKQLNPMTISLPNTEKEISCGENNRISLFRDGKEWIRPNWQLDFFEVYECSSEILEHKEGFNFLWKRNEVIGEIVELCSNESSIDQERACRKKKYVEMLDGRLKKPITFKEFVDR